MANLTEKLPSPAGRKALLNIHAGRYSAKGLKGVSAMGGHYGTMIALRERGLVTWDDQLTDAGKAMVERLTISPEVRNAA